MQNQFTARSAFPLLIHRPRLWLFVGAGILVLFLSLVAIPYWSLTNEYQVAYQRWEQVRPQHYTYQALWKGVLFQIEIQNGEAVQVIELATQNPPEPFFWSYADDYVLIDQLFQELDQVLHPPPADIREYLARTYPSSVTLWLKPCVSPLPSIRYNPRWAYPEYVIFKIHTCAARSAFDTRETEELTIDKFQPLY